MSNFDETVKLAVDFDFDYSKLPHPSTREGELEFLSTYDPTKYGVAPDDVVMTADACVFTVVDDVLKILLIKRGNHPYKDFWCLPGGFIDLADGNPAVAAVRELEEETGVTGLKPMFVNVYQYRWRDPRLKNNVSFAFGFYVEETIKAVGADDAVDAKWVDAKDVLNGNIPVGFDHQLIIADAITTVF